MVSAFEASRAIGNNLAGAFRRSDDNKTIEGILSQAMATDDPKVLQDSIGKILSKVSPERQPAAIKYLESVYENVQNQQKIAREQAAAKEVGYTYGAPPAVQAQQVKNKAREDEWARYGIGQPNQNAIANSSLNGQFADSVSTPKTTDKDLTVFESMTDGQLELATGSTNKAISEPSKQVLDRRKEARAKANKIEGAVLNRDLGISSKVLARADEIAEALPQKESALKSMDDAIANKNLSFWSLDNLAELTGIEGLRSSEGTIFKTAGKEYFLGNITRAGARPNQWIEQQIQDMMTKIGRSTAANLSVSRALRNEIDIEKERVRLTHEISDRLEKQGDVGQRKLGSMVNAELSKFAEKKQNELFNDLRAIKAIDEKSPQKFRKVETGTPVSKYVAKALLRQFNNDPKKAQEEAKKLGYAF